MHCLTVTCPENLNGNLVFVSKCLLLILYFVLWHGIEVFEKERTWITGRKKECNENDPSALAKGNFILVIINK